MNKDQIIVEVQNEQRKQQGVIKRLYNLVRGKEKARTA